MPFLLLVFLAVLWLVPMSLIWQQRLFTAAECFYAWSTVDVLALSLIAAQLQIEQFVTFIVGSKCDSINAILRSLGPSILPVEDEVCFDIRAFLDAGSWVLFCSAVLSTFVTIVVTRSCDTALHERALQVQTERRALRRALLGIAPISTAEGGGDFEAAATAAAAAAVAGGGGGGVALHSPLEQIGARLDEYSARLSYCVVASLAACKLLRIETTSEMDC